MEWKTPHKEREMAFCYVNALFKDTIKRDCPDEVVKIITCYAKSMRLFKSVNDQLNICPRMAQFEQWEKEAKAFKNAPQVKQQLKTLLGGTRIKRDSLMPHRDGGITRGMLETRYLNHYVLEHIRDRICRYKSERMKKIKERWIAPSGATRAFSRNPFVSRVSEMWGSQDPMEDWAKMLAFKDSNKYSMVNRGVYFIEEDGVVRPR